MSLFRLQWRSGGDSRAGSRGDNGDDDGGDGKGIYHSPLFEGLRAVVVKKREGEKEAIL
jgi:hypothetical protein